MKLTTSFLLILVTTATACPTTPQCVCINANLHCVHANLRKIPDSIPNWITTIDIQHGLIEVIETQQISHLEALREFHIVKNRISKIQTGAFDNLVALNSVSLRDNNLTSLQPGIFSHLTRLTKLILSQNSLFNVEGVFDGLGSLTVLLLDDNQITGLTQRTFRDLVSLQHLEINNNLIQTIATDTFSHSKFLIQLSLGSNPLKTTHDSFGSLQSTMYINLTNCQLSRFPDNLPATLTHLKLGSNRITSIYRSDTHNYTKLNVVFLDNNNLTYIEDGAFSHMTSLVDVFLYVNDLDTIPGPFPASVQNIHLDENRITAILPNMFQNGTVLETLSVRRNQISSVTTLSFQNLELMQNLHLEWNPLPMLSDHMFLLTVGLEHLSLNHMHFEAIHSQCFLGLDNLQTLEMSHVMIRSDDIYGNFFQHTPMLTSLELENSPTLANYILSNIEVLESLMNLTEINLKNNHITTINYTFASNLINLHTIKLAGNPFHCDMDIVWLVNWHSIEPHRFQDFMRLYCHTPASLLGVPLVHLHGYDMYNISGHIDTNYTYNASDTVFDGIPDHDVNYTNDHYYPDLNATHIPYYDHTHPDEAIHDEFYYRYPDPFDNYDNISVTTQVDMANESATLASTLTNTDTPNEAENPTHTTIQPVLDESSTVNTMDISPKTTSTNHSTASKLTTTTTAKTTTDKQPEQEMANPINIRSIGIAVGMGLGVLAFMVIIAAIVLVFWKRRQATVQPQSALYNGTDDYVFIVSKTDTTDKTETTEEAIVPPRKLTRQERGSTTSRASEDITNHTDVCMKVYTLDVDA